MCIYREILKSSWVVRHARKMEYLPTIKSRTLSMRLEFNICEHSGLDMNMDEAKTHHRIARCGGGLSIYLGRDPLIPEQQLSK